MEEKIEMQIAAISRKLSYANSFSIILAEKNGLRKLAILVGVHEAQAIALALENIKINRPLTHDLMRDILFQLEVDIKEIDVYAYRDNIYFSKIIGKDKFGYIHKFEARVSDAIAIAVRTHCPIYMNEEIIAKNKTSVLPTKPPEESIDLQKEDNDKSIYTAETIKFLNKEELNQKLEEVINQENYLLAAIIRDEIKSRTH